MCKTCERVSLFYYTFPQKESVLTKIIVMIVKKLDLYNFRNYIKGTAYFSDGLNIVAGKNAQGKTNLIEGIYLLATGTSPRLSNDKGLIRKGESYARVTATAENSGGEFEVEMLMSKNAKKCASVNGMPIAKIGELIGNIRAIYFSPDEMSLIKDSPDFRRRFMDIDLSQVDRSYFYALNKYNKVLRQRNALLKDESLEKIKNTISLWDEQLAKEGARLIVARRAFCKELSVEAERIHSRIAPDERLQIAYSTSVESDDEDGIAFELEEKLRKAVERDTYLKFTSVGPQRDDIKITLSGEDVRTFGSQGQQRTATLSLKLAEIAIFEKLSGEKPILLLDDVMSELDKDRRTRLLAACEGGQTIVTTTDEEEFSGNNVIRIENGNIYQ